MTDFVFVKTSSGGYNVFPVSSKDCLGYVSRRPRGGWYGLNFRGAFVASTRQQVAEVLWKEWQARAAVVRAG